MNLLGTRVPTVRPLPMIQPKKSWNVNVFTMSRILGNFPFDGNFLCTKRIVACTYVFLMVTTLVSVWGLYYAYVLDIGNRNERERVSYSVLYLSGAASLIVVYLHNLILIKGSDVIGKCASILNPWEMRECSSLHTVITGISTLVVKYVIMARTFHLNGKTYKNAEELVHLFVNTQTFLILCHFTCMLKIARTKLRTIIDKENARETDCHTHFDLVLLLKALNRMYGWQMLVTFFQIFSQFLTAVFWIVMNINRMERRKINRTQCGFIAGNLFQVVFCIYELSLIISSCTETMVKVEEFTNKLNRSLRNELMSSNVVAAAITYLVVLLQFANS